METWGFCGQCDRWFYVERSTQDDPTLSTCPVCATAPEALAQREASAAEEAQRGA